MIGRTATKRVPEGMARSCPHRINQFSMSATIPVKPESTREWLSPDDKRVKILEATMKKHLYARDSLIEVLHKGQEIFGYLDEPLLRHVAAKLRLSPSRVFGVATFYHHFTLKPQGEHTCVVCMGTACYIKGSAGLLDAIHEQAGVRAGQTTADGKLSVIAARCIGSCGFAPAVVVDGEVVAKATPEIVKSKLEPLLK